MRTLVFMMNFNQFYRCRLRVLDSFGTWPEYNDPSYPFSIPGGRSPWANMNLLMPQFLTLYREYFVPSFYNFDFFLLFMFCIV